MKNNRAGEQGTKLKDGKTGDQGMGLKNDILRRPENGTEERHAVEIGERD